MCYLKTEKHCKYRVFVAAFLAHCSVVRAPYRMDLSWNLRFVSRVFIEVLIYLFEVLIRLFSVFSVKNVSRWSLFAMSDTVSLCAVPTQCDGLGTLFSLDVPGNISKELSCNLRDTNLFISLSRCLYQHQPLMIAARFTWGQSVCVFCLLRSWRCKIKFYGLFVVLEI